MSSGVDLVCYEQLCYRAQMAIRMAIQYRHPYTLGHRVCIARASPLG
jgi:hypothetical protein